jgi:nucleotide-binding universal stress UspA family protein
VADVSGTAPTRGTAPITPETIEAVLVPLDRSSFSTRAVGVAAQLAGRLDADVHLFAAVETVDEVPERDAELAAITIADHPVQRTVVVDRDPAGAIHEELRRLGRAVACMASHGRGRSAALLGSVAAEVIARGHDPLVLVGPAVGDDGRHYVGQGVVACVDESPSSFNVAEVGLQWAELLLEPLTVVTVGEPVPPSVTAGPPRRSFGPDEDLDLFLAAVVRRLPHDGVPIEARPIYDPISPASGLADYLEEHPAFLVVAGAHPRRGVKRLVAGRATAAIVHDSSAPVLVVPLPESGA